MKNNLLNEVLKNLRIFELQFNKDRLKLLTKESRNPIKIEQSSSPFTNHNQDSLFLDTATKPHKSRKKKCLQYLRKGFKQKHKKLLFYELDMPPGVGSSFIEMIPDVVRLDEDFKMLSHLGFNFLQVRKEYKDDLMENVQLDLEDISETFVFRRDADLLFKAFWKLKRRFQLSHVSLIKILFYYFEIPESLIIKSIMNSPSGSQPGAATDAICTEDPIPGDCGDARIGSIYPTNLNMNHRFMDTLAKYENGRDEPSQSRLTKMQVRRQGANSR